METDHVLADLMSSMHAGVYATDLEGRVTFVNAEALRLIDRPDEDLIGVKMHGLIHYQDAVGRPTSASSCPLLAVASTGLPARTDNDTFWLPDGSPLPVSWMSAPVLREGRATGVVVVFFDATQHRVEETVRDAREERLAQAGERSAETAERLAVLARVSEALATLDADEGLARLARLLVGRLADWCVVHAVDDLIIRRVAMARRSGQVEPVATVVDRPGPGTAAVGAFAAALAGGSLHLVDVEAMAEIGAMDPEPVGPGGAIDPVDIELASIIEMFGAAHAVVVPVVIRRDIVATITLGRLNPELPFDESDLFLFEEIARRAAPAIDNAQTFGRQRSLAETLQRSMLTLLPEPDHLHLVARYLPATEGAEVGGDWYDAFLLPDGATALVIGDIVGHDLAAASRMGQIRNVLRGIAWDRQEPPSEIVRRLDESLVGLHVDGLATLVLARVEQVPEQQSTSERTLRWTNAGHPPPAIVGADGRVRLLDADPDLMLGVDPTLPRVDHTTVLEPGDTLWFYTDGLVERSDLTLDTGLARLRRALTAVATVPVEEACDEVLVRMLPDGHPDDVALLAVRAYAEDRPRPKEAGPSVI